jgi:hypothetical protein
MRNTELNGKTALRWAGGALAVGGRILRTAAVERFPGTVSAFHNGSQGMSPRSPSRRPISTATGFATNPGMKPACTVRTAVRRLAWAAFLYRRANPQGSNGSRLALRTAAHGVPISKYAAGTPDATPSKVTRRDRRCSQ